MNPIPFEPVMTAALFVGARIAGMMIFPPFFGSDAIPLPVKAGATIALTALLYPVYGPQGLRVDTLGWLRVLAGEVLAGLLLGLVLQFVFEAAQFAGQVAGVQT